MTYSRETSTTGDYIDDDATVCVGTVHAPDAAFCVHESRLHGEADYVCEACDVEWSFKPAPRPAPVIERLAA
jgi:hypothetical protein